MSNSPFNTYKKYGKLTSYENTIKIQDSYVLSNSLIPCCLYTYKNGTIYQVTPELEDSAKITLTKLISNTATNDYKTYIENYTHLLSQPVPFIKRCAIDIEVRTQEGKFPSLLTHENSIIAISFYSNDGFKHAIVLDDVLDDKSGTINPYIEVVKTEQELIERTFLILNEYPIILTYNGDNFDLAYIHQRSLTFDDIDQSLNPIIYSSENVNTNIIDPALLKNGLHLDLYRLFKNVSLHNYGFNHKYNSFGLKEVAQAMLNDTKIDVNSKDINDLSKNKLCEYCLKDSELTLRLTTYSDDLVMKLLFTIARITKTTLEDIDRYGISNWVKSMLYYEHRKQGVLIPHKDDLKVKGERSTDAKIKGKKFEGAYVMDPVIGTHFNVTCLDFSSLYPSIIKTCNLSYETINCEHEDCKEKNHIEGTKHHYCNKRQGILSLIIGVIRDLRVEYFKKLTKDNTLTAEQRELYDAITQASKVILNGSYGVVGSESFNLFCLPVAEGITAIGRNIITSTIEYANSLDIKILYSDTDSVFVLSPSQEQIKQLIDYARNNYSIDLEVDKTYKYIIFSYRKKNYFGIQTNNKIDTKGLTGKKSNIPVFVKACFNEIINILKDVNNERELSNALSKIEKIVKEYVINLRNKNYNIDDLTFHSVINKELDKYGIDKDTVTDLFGIITTTKKSIPMHVKIAMQLKELGDHTIGEKSSISYIKTTSGPKSSSEIIHKNDIDINIYIDTFKTALEPILDTLNINFDELITYTTKQVRLDSLI